RRRHTRFSRDWSSDVCSSDLPWKLLAVLCRHVDLDSVELLQVGVTQELTDRDQYLAIRVDRVPGEGCYPNTLSRRISDRQIVLRSEERRVGKEWRCRWWGYT